MALIVPSIFTAIDKFSAPVRAMGNNVAAFAAKSEAAIQRADRSINKYFSVFSHVQKELLSTFGVAAIAYKGIQAIEFGLHAVEAYDTSIAKLQSNFRLSDAAISPFKKSIEEVAKGSYKAAADVSEVFNIIGSKNRELINNPDAIAERAKSSILLSKALRTELIPTAESLTAIMKGFGLNDSAKVIDQITAASSSGSVQGLALTEALKSISQEAHHANIGLGQAAAMIEFIDSKAQDGGESAKAFIKTLLKLETMGRSYRNAQGKFDINSAITGMRKDLDKLSPRAQEMYLKNAGISSAKSIAVGRALLSPGALVEIEAYQKQTEITGLAEKAAAINTGTLSSSIEMLKNSFGNALIESNNMNTALSVTNEIVKFMYKHMDAILNVIGLLIGAFIVWKTAMMSIAIGKAIFEGLTYAINLYKLATYLAADATGILKVQQIALNLVMEANPVFLFISALALLGVAIYAAFGKNEDLNNSLSKTKQLSEDILGKIKDKSAVEKAAAKEAYLTNAAGNSAEKQLDIYSKAIANIDSATNKAIANTNIIKTAINQEAIKHADATGYIADDDYMPRPAINSEKARQDSMISRTETTQKQNTKIEILDHTGRAKVSSDNNMVPITTTTTMANGLDRLDKF